MYTVEQFKADVIAECVALREHATKEELGRVTEKINPMSDSECFYGRMTGSCQSKRAVHLIQQCCLTSIGGYLNISRSINLNGVEIIKGNAAAKDRTGIDFPYLSALEAYIHFPSANIPAIQSYLTGQTETLEL